MQEDAFHMVPVFNATPKYRRIRSRLRQRRLHLYERIEQRVI